MAVGLSALGILAALLTGGRGSGAEFKPVAVGVIEQATVRPAHDDRLTIDRSALLPPDRAASTLTTATLAPAADDEHPRDQASLARLLRRQSVGAPTGRPAFPAHGLRSRNRLAPALSGVRTETAASMQLEREAVAALRRS